VRGRLVRTLVMLLGLGVALMMDLSSESNSIAASAVLHPQSARVPTHARHGRNDARTRCLAQFQLKTAGYDPGPLDCQWGPKSVQALAAFQRDSGLSPTGQLDVMTGLALRKAREVLSCHKSGKTVTDCLASVSLPATPPPVPRSHRQHPARFFAHAACARAYNRCVGDCTGPVFDYDKGTYRYNTDFEDNCEGSCLAGGNACDGVDETDDDDAADERCDEFQSSCNNDCDSDAFDYDRGDYIEDSDAEDLCEDACSTGYAACG
jgi:hypothetical protein